MELANPEIELITDPKSHQRCSFCDSVVNNRLRYGDMYKYKHIICHYFCVLMSSQLQQNGADNEGFFGFLLKDLQKELDRAKSVKCSFCKRAGATAQCNFKRARQKCQNTFHFTCGITHGTLHYFFGKFQSLCVTHRRPQKIPEEFIKDAATQCCICHEFIQDVNSDYSSLWASCCKKSFFHKDCVQHQAFVSGDYHFKCPLCNNHDEFKRAMLKCGIFLPIRDAEWEREPNAYSDLYREHNLCDIEPCLCPHGTKDCETRRYNSGAWDIVRCSTCGSEGTHRPCSGLPLKGDVTWSCATCRQIMNKEKDLRSSTGQDTEDERKVIEPDTCSADFCFCNKGREHRGDRGMYRAVYCGDCEYSWIHTRCRNEAYGEVAKGEWICTGCQMSDNEDSEVPGTSNQEAVPRDPLAVEELTKKQVSSPCYVVLEPMFVRSSYQRISHLLSARAYNKMLSERRKMMKRKGFVSKGNYWFNSSSRQEERTLGDDSIMSASEYSRIDVTQTSDFNDTGMFNITASSSVEEKCHTVRISQNDTDSEINVLDSDIHEDVIKQGEISTCFTVTAETHCRKEIEEVETEETGNEREPNLFQSIKNAFSKVLKVLSPNKMEKEKTGVEIEEIKDSDLSDRGISELKENMDVSNITNQESLSSPNNVLRIEYKRTNNNDGESYQNMEHDNEGLKKCEIIQISDTQNERKDCMKITENSNIDDLKTTERAKDSLEVIEGFNKDISKPTEDEKKNTSSRTENSNRDNLKTSEDFSTDISNTTEDVNKNTSSRTENSNRDNLKTSEDSSTDISNTTEDVNKNSNRDNLKTSEDSSKHISNTTEDVDENSNRENLKTSEDSNKDISNTTEDVNKNTSSRTTNTKRKILKIAEYFNTDILNTTEDVNKNISCRTENANRDNLKIAEYSNTDILNTTADVNKNISSRTENANRDNLKTAEDSSTDISNTTEDVNKNTSSRTENSNRNNLKTAEDYNKDSLDTTQEPHRECLKTIEDAMKERSKSIKDIKKDDVKTNESSKNDNLKITDKLEMESLKAIEDSHEEILTTTEDSKKNSSQASQEAKKDGVKRAKTSKKGRFRTTENSYVDSLKITTEESVIENIKIIEEPNKDVVKITEDSNKESINSMEESNADGAKRAKKYKKSRFRTNEDSNMDSLKTTDESVMENIKTIQENKEDIVKMTEEPNKESIKSLEESNADGAKKGKNSKTSSFRINENSNMDSLKTTDESVMENIKTIQENKKDIVKMTEEPNKESIKSLEESNADGAKRAKNSKTSSFRINENSNMDSLKTTDESVIEKIKTIEPNKDVKITDSNKESIKSWEKSNADGAKKGKNSKTSSFRTNENSKMDSLKTTDESVIENFETIDDSKEDGSETIEDFNKGIEALQVTENCVGNETDDFESKVEVKDSRAIHEKPSSCLANLDSPDEKSMELLSTYIENPIVFKADEEESCNIENNGTNLNVRTNNDKSDARIFEDDRVQTEKRKSHRSAAECKQVAKKQQDDTVQTEKWKSHRSAAECKQVAKKQQDDTVQTEKWKSHRSAAECKQVAKKQQDDTVQTEKWKSHRSAAECKQVAKKQQDDTVQTEKWKSHRSAAECKQVAKKQQDDTVQTEKWKSHRSAAECKQVAKKQQDDTVQTEKWKSHRSAAECKQVAKEQLRILQKSYRELQDQDKTSLCGKRKCKAYVEEPRAKRKRKNKDNEEGKKIIESKDSDSLKCCQSTKEVSVMEFELKSGNEILLTCVRSNERVLRRSRLFVRYETEEIRIKDEPNDKKALENANDKSENIKNSKDKHEIMKVFDKVMNTTVEGSVDTSNGSLECKTNTGEISEDLKRGILDDVMNNTFGRLTGKPNCNLEYKAKTEITPEDKQVKYNSRKSGDKQLVSYSTKKIFEYFNCVQTRTFAMSESNTSCAITTRKRTLTESKSEEPTRKRQRLTQLTASTNMIQMKCNEDRQIVTRRDSTNTIQMKCNEDRQIVTRRDSIRKLALTPNKRKSKSAAKQDTTSRKIYEFFSVQSTTPPTPPNNSRSQFMNNDGKNNCNPDTKHRAASELCNNKVKKSNMSNSLAKADLSEESTSKSGRILRRQSIKVDENYSPNKPLHEGNVSPSKRRASRRMSVARKDLSVFL